MNTGIYTATKICNHDYPNRIIAGNCIAAEILRFDAWTGDPVWIGRRILCLGGGSFGRMRVLQFCNPFRLDNAGRQIHKFKRPEVTCKH